METVYNKIVSTKSDELFQFCYPGTDSPELLFTLYCLFFKVLRLFLFTRKKRWRCEQLQLLISKYMCIYIERITCANISSFF